MRVDTAGDQVGKGVEGDAAVEGLLCRFNFEV